MLVVAGALAVTLLATRAPRIEWIGAGAVLLSFAHAQVAERYAEKDRERTVPDVSCRAWLRRYFIGKEALWVIYFATRGAWSALVGCGVFLAYPAWRAWWRR